SRLRLPVNTATILLPVNTTTILLPVNTATILLPVNTATILLPVNTATILLPFTVWKLPSNTLWRSSRKQRRTERVSRSNVNASVT
ncbi:hypothetical protein LSAT2_008001, partial [Lamellibrachia satsuma]